MAQDRIDLGAQRATLILDERPVETLSFAEIRELHIVSPDFGWLHDDEPFYVLVAEDRVWVVPDDAVGLPALLEVLVPRLSKEHRVRRTTTPKVPWAWRRGRFLRAFPIPRLSRHGVDTLPDWEPGSVSPDDIHRLTGVEP